MTAKKADRLGTEYWATDLSREQSYFCAALTEDYKPLRRVFIRVKKDALFPIKANTKWEKLCVLGLMDVDRSRRDDVYVKRGNQWLTWWESLGLSVTNRQLTSHDVFKEMREIFGWPNEGVV